MLHPYIPCMFILRNYMFIFSILTLILYTWTFIYATVHSLCTHECLFCSYMNVRVAYTTVLLVHANTQGTFMLVLWTVMLVLWTFMLCIWTFMLCIWKFMLCECLLTFAHVRSFFYMYIYFVYMDHDVVKLYGFSAFIENIDIEDYTPVIWECKSSSMPFKSFDFYCVLVLFACTVFTCRCKASNSNNPIYIIVEQI